MYRSTSDLRSPGTRSETACGQRTAAARVLSSWFEPCKLQHLTDIDFPQSLRAAPKARTKNSPLSCSLFECQSRKLVSVPHSPREQPAELLGPGHRRHVSRGPAARSWSRTPRRIWRGHQKLRTYHQAVGLIQRHLLLLPKSGP